MGIIAPGIPGRDRDWAGSETEPETSRTSLFGLPVATGWGDPDRVLNHGLAGWLLRWWRRSEAPLPRLTLLERLPLGPRQALSLVEAEGVRLLVATSAEGTPAIYPLYPPQRALSPIPQSRPRRGRPERRLGLESRDSW
jgi:hypothetical protein